MKDKISKSRRVKCTVINVVMYIVVALVCSLVIGLTVCILYKGLPNVSWELLSSKPSLIKDTVGILPNILNTVYIIVMTLIIVLPIGVGTAIYLNEYTSNKRVVRIIELATEILSGIPSIIYGLVGMLVFVQFFSLGTSLIAGALTLSIMTLPIVIRTTQESLKVVPNSYREGALAMGSGKWHMVRTVVLPSAVDGIVTGCILAIGRIVGESAALLFTAGMTNEILGFFEAFTVGKSGSTLAVSLYVYAKERGDFNTAFAIATILLIITSIINLLAKSLMLHLKKSIRND